MTLITADSTLPDKCDDKRRTRIAKCPPIRCVVDISFGGAFPKKRQKNTKTPSENDYCETGTKISFRESGIQKFRAFQKSSKYERKNDHTNENELFLKNLTNKKHKLIGLVYIINNKKILEKNKFNLGGKKYRKNSARNIFQRNNSSKARNDSPRTGNNDILRHIATAATQPISPVSYLSARYRASHHKYC